MVLEIGTGVSKVAVGDEVVLSWIKGSGIDAPGTRYLWEGGSVSAGGITTFGRRMVISENRLTRKPAGLCLRAAALLGCAVPTGFGAVYNTGRLQPGETVAVFGAGGVGSSAIAAAAAGGAAAIIAIDIVPAKLEIARQLGATHTIDASATPDAAAAIRDLTGQVDLAIEATGRPAVMARLLDCVRSQGGRAVIVGNAPYLETVTLDPRQFNQGKSLLGSWGGDSRPDIDFPRYAGLIAAGKAQIAPLTANCYTLEDADVALQDLERGAALRPLLDFGIDSGR